MPAEFPFPSVSGSNPTPSHYEQNPETFNVGRTVMDDNTIIKKLQSGGAGRKSYLVRYGPISIAAATILDNWAATMAYSEDEGSGYGANFREHVPGTAYTDTSGTLRSNVYIAPGGYKKSHGKYVGAQYREFLLEKHG